MKMASFLVSALFAGTAFAGYTTVYHDYDGALRGIALDNACITDTEVRTIKPMKTCAKLVPVEHPGSGGDGDQPYTDWVCEQWQVTHLAYSRSFERPVCTAYNPGHGEAGNPGCEKVEVKMDFLPATIKVSVVTHVGGEAGDNFPGVQGTHTFPACQ